MKAILFLFLGVAASAFGRAEGKGSGSSILLLDISGSMSERIRGSEKTKIEAVASALDALGRQLEREEPTAPSVRLFAFTTRIELRGEVKPGAGAAVAMARVIEQLGRLVAANRGTALYDSLRAALEEVERGSHVHVISDGIDNSSSAGALENALQIAAVRRVKINFLGLGADVLAPLRDDLKRVGDLGGLVATSETRDLTAALIPPRLIVVEREGVVDVVAVGAATVGSTLTWWLDGQVRAESSEHLRFSAPPGEHCIEVRATLAGNMVLGASRTFAVDPPKPPQARIIALGVGQQPYVAGKRATVMLVPSAAKVEWSSVGASLHGVQGDRATFVLGEGPNTIRARVNWPNGAASDVEAIVCAEASQENLVLQASSAIVGKETTVRALLAGRPIAAEIRLGDARSPTGELRFVPEQQRDYLVTAEFDDEGLHFRAQTKLSAVYPAFSVEIGGPAEVDHGQEVVFTALLDGEDEARSLQWTPKDLMKGDDRIVRFRAENETGEPLVITIGLEVLGSSGRRFKSTRELRVNPRAARPVAALFLPGEVVRVGDAFPLACRSSGAISGRWISVDGGPARPLDEVAEVRFERAGEHRLKLEVAGAGGRASREYNVNVVPALVPPVIVEIDGIPARAYTGEALSLTAKISGDAKRLVWRANGVAIGETGQISFTPPASGWALLEVEARPAAAEHPVARKQITVEVRPKWQKLFYEHPQHTAGGCVALVGLFGLWALINRGPRLRGTLAVRDSERSAFINLSGKSFDLKAALKAHGWDPGSERLSVLVLPGGEVALARDGDTKILPEAQACCLTDCLTATWTNRGKVAPLNSPSFN